MANQSFRSEFAAALLKQTQLTYMTRELGKVSAANSLRPY